MMKCIYRVLLIMLATAIGSFSFHFANSKRGSREILSMTLEEDAGLVWREVKGLLPPIITGAWTGDEGDEQPLGALYNLIFVRFVTLVCTVAYSKALLDGGGQFSLDFGGGPVEVPPFGVAIVVARILFPEMK